MMSKMNIGERLKNIRVSRNLTLDEMAKILEYNTRSAVYKIENGDINLTTDKVEFIAKKLGISMEELLCDSYDYLDAKEVIRKAEEYNGIDDILYSVYKIHKETYYDLAIIAPCWYPEKVFGEEENIILLRKGPYNSSYEIYHDNLKIAYIQCGAGASNLADAMMCLTNANVKTIVFLGAVGALNRQIEIGTIVTPSECISFDGVTPFFKCNIEKKMYGSSVHPHNDEYIEEIINRCMQNNIIINKGKVFCTDSVIFEYSHLDEIKSTGAQYIEMETAAFYSCLRIMNKGGIALLLVSDNSQNNKSIVEKTIDDSNNYNNVRSNTLKSILKLV